MKKQTYEGEWQNDRQHGYGVCKYKTGDKFEGTWEYGSMKNGKMTARNGKVDIVQDGGLKR